MRRSRLIAISIATALSLLVGHSAVWAKATPGTAKGKTGQVLSVSNVKNLPPAGSWVTITGKKFDETVGIYVSLCVVTPKGVAPTPCGGGVDMTGSSKASVWISSNPPRYGVALATPYKVNGTFAVKIKVGAKVGKFDCRKVKCAIVSKADHTNPEDRSADVLVPVTFAKK